MKNSRRNKQLKMILLVVLALVMSVSMAGCTSFDNFKMTFIDKSADKDSEAIYIGVFEPQTGDLEDKGKDIIKGIELAHSMYDNVAGADVKLVYVDTQSSTDTARTAIKSLIKLKPSVIIGGAGEANSMIAGPYIKEARIPTITPSATNPLITEGNPYYFRVCMTSYQTGAGMADYAVNQNGLGSKSIGLVSVENDSSVAAAVKDFTEKTDQLDGDDHYIVMNTTISAAKPKLNKLMEKIKKSGVDAVYLPVGTEMADRVFSRAEKMGMTNITFLGTRGWTSSDFVDMMKKHPDIKVAFPSDTVVQANGSTTGTVTAETQKFLIEYANKYGDKDIPTEEAAEGYDAYLLAMNAINSSRSLKTTDIRDSLASIDNVRCATGVFTFDENGNPVRSVNVSKIKNGQIVSAYVTDTTTKAKNIKKLG